MTAEEAKKQAQANSQTCAPKWTIWNTLEMKWYRFRIKRNVKKGRTCMQINIPVFSNGFVLAQLEKEGYRVESDFASIDDSVVHYLKWD